MFTRNLARNAPRGSENEWGLDCRRPDLGLSRLRGRYWQRTTVRRGSPPPGAEDTAPPGRECLQVLAPRPGVPVHFEELMSTKKWRAVGVLGEDSRKTGDTLERVMNALESEGYDVTLPVLMYGSNFMVIGKKKSRRSKPDPTKPPGEGTQR